MRFRSAKPFAWTIESTVTPYRCAIRFSVSPPSTVCVRCCGGANAGDGDGDGDGNGGGLETGPGFGNSVGLAAGAGVAVTVAPDVPSAQLTAKNNAITPTISTAPRISV